MRRTREKLLACPERPDVVTSTIVVTRTIVNVKAAKCKSQQSSNIVEQDHRAVKRVTRPMLGFKSFEAAQSTLVGIELMHMLKKRQLVAEAGVKGLTAAEQFFSLAA